MEWKPTRTLAECHTLMTAPGAIHEVELQLIDGRVLKCYKNMWPSVREFFLLNCAQFENREVIVYEGERLTFKQTREQALKLAGMLHDVYGIKKGDHVGIVSRNYPEYIVTFFAASLLGAVPVLANAWLPSKPLHHCIKLAKCKVVVADSERARVLDPSYLRRETGTRGFLVIRPSGGRHHGWTMLKDALASYKGTGQDVLKDDPGIVPEDNATIFFTSGTTGLPKGVLSSQRAFLSNSLSTLVSPMRLLHRRGEPIPEPDPNEQKAALLSVPLFHVTGFTSFTMSTYMNGSKLVLMNKWVPEVAAEIIKKEKINSMGGVPSMVADIMESTAAGAESIEALSFGGAPAHGGLPSLAGKKFPNAYMAQAYGTTETNSISVSFAGEDYVQRPLSTGLPIPIVDLCIVKDGKVMKPRETGEVWIKGSNIMRGYYNDPVATAKAITPDGWYQSGDIGMLDEEGFLYIKDRAKDIIIRGGENIDSTSVENAIYADERVLEAAVVAVPDKRLGELPAAVVTLKKGFDSEVTEEGLIASSSNMLAKYSVPVMIIIQKEPLERNPAGKILKPPLREKAKKEWLQRQASKTTGKAKL